MKKSLFALAAVGAFAGAAQAQSSVTVYGILDVGYVGGNERISGVSSSNTIAPGNTVLKQATGTFGQSAQSTSRLGFRGTEDLGGGTRAFFTLEMEVIPNGAASPIAGGTANRLAFAGLSQKGIGQASLGLVNTLVTDAMSPTITGEMNNIAGSLLFPGGIQGRTGIAGNESTSYLNTNSANGNTSAFTFRTTNTLKLQTERFAGIQASAMWVMNNQTDTQGTISSGNQGYSGGKNNQDGWGLGLNYQWQKLLVTGAYQSFKATNPYNATTANVANGGIDMSAANGGPAAFGNAGTGTNVKDDQAYVGATYDFGILRAYAGWVNRKLTSQINPNAFAKRTAQEIGVRANLTKTVQSWASIGNGRFQTFGVGEPTANIFGWQVGTNYILSKRTNLYAIYGQNGTSNASQTPGANPVSYRQDNYALGVRHTF